MANKGTGLSSTKVGSKTGYIQRSPKSATGKPMGTPVHKAQPKLGAKKVK